MNSSTWENFDVSCNLISSCNFLSTLSNCYRKILKEDLLSVKKQNLMLLTKQPKKNIWNVTDIL